ncbi:MAG: TonB-dependent receptor plug domain-containing protein, partial [Steroidobacteraceae bacterium]
MYNSTYDQPRARALQVVGLILCNTIFAATSALAQSDPAADGTKIEEIVVTGSHIQRDGYSGLEPIQTLDTAAIEASGSAQFQDLLKHFPSNSGSLLPFGEDRQTGTSQFSLRGLGLSSTLTLLNGKRVGITPLGGLVGTGEDFTDINQFPLAMVKR